MKLYISAYICIALCAQSVHCSTTIQKTIPNSNAPAVKPVVVDPDTQVVSETMGTLITALATFSQNPNNPVIAGACALQALGAFIKMLIQIFDEAAPTRSLKTQEEIEQWFINLPREKQLQIMQLMIVYARAYNKN